ncbi:hypothetical protein ACSYAY_02280 [Leptospirillum ferriphilum]|jgi:hypothetical protein|uniref:Outer membrane protein beta-barrel domain-containing protein n=2 Tax=Leptospirillum TaxID=179 RepID=A0A094WEL0_9BACT|nr:hypothetical protein [Leptospirillum ferriphilum]EDZ39654.1 MAG: Protein of unknown function [Leptospirillum sp. Group II '5-way CG']KGA94975.1 hypothetical protein LptCag_2409 [Leptospirillum ferriphilum]
MEVMGGKFRGRYLLVFLCMCAALVCLVPERASASPGGNNLFGVGIEGEGMDPVNVPGADGKWLAGGGFNLQYWFTKNFGVRAGADYLANTMKSSAIPGDILPFYSGLLVNLFTWAQASVDVFGDFGQAMLNGVDNTYFDAGAQVNTALSSGRQFFLEVRWREIGAGVFPVPYQFVSIGAGVNIF